VEKRFEIYAQLAAVIILVTGCFLVLRPFMTAMLLAAVVCISTWPVYLWLLRKLKNQPNLAALTMTFSLTLLVILPLALVAYNLADNVTAFYDAVKQSMEAGPPAWLTGLPLLGGPIEEYWRNLAGSPEEMLSLARNLLEPTRNFLLTSGILLGNGVLEMSLAAFIGFFFYRDGAVLARLIGVGMERLAGIHAANMLAIINSTVRGVMYGLLGTALAQGFVAAIGFAIAGLPAVMLLSVATSLLSLIPVGPPLIWGGAAIWLFQQGETGWAIFMVLYGFFLISSVDNVVKPLLISHGSRLPFLLVILGVMGGVLAFGFVGVFIGPALLAVGFSIAQKWTSTDSAAAS
jgi:predicted PurR-regulated permease PerM